jgi:predicted amidohydrolase YtcJ
MMSAFRSVGPRLCLLAILAGCAPGAQRAGAVPPVAPADLLIVGARVFTGDDRQPWAEALATRGDRILAVGSREAVEGMAGPDTRRIEAGGRLVIPGINDAHVHSGLSVERVAIPGVGPASLLPELLDSLAAVSARTPEHRWISGSVGPGVLLDPRATRFALDSAAPRHSVYLLSFVGHGLVLNSAAMRELAVPEAEADPFGGWYGRIPGSDAPSGLMHGYPGFEVRRRLARMRTDEDQVGALRRFATDLATFGITSVQDMPVAGASHLLRWLEEAAVPIRWRVIDFPFTRHPSADDSPRASGLKWIVEGTPIEGGVLTRQPYGDREGHHGRGYIPLDTLSTLLREALVSRRQLLLHVAGDSAWAAVLSTMQALAPDSVWQRLRPRVEHGDNLAPDQLAAVRRLGIVVVQNPSHLDHPELMRLRYPGRVGDYQPLRSLVEAGIPLALGSDGPLNPFLNIHGAASHPNNPAEALSVEEALLAYTRGAAYAEFTDHEKGILAPGMLADLAVLSQDIFSIALQELPSTRAVLTMVGGRIVHDELSGR